MMLYKYRARTAYYALDPSRLALLTDCRRSQRTPGHLGFKVPHFRLLLLSLHEASQDDPGTRIY